MSADDYAVLISIVSQRLMRMRDKNEGVLHEGDIASELDRELDIFEYDVDREKVLAELEKNFAILIGEASFLYTEDQSDRPEAPWVSDRISSRELQWNYWTRYRQYLLTLGWAGPVVSKLDQVTSEILDSMMPPDTQGQWDQRGLVVGHVQSGKTSNYTGLICKAVDAGYKVIIVLAGGHNNLRSQTQVRLEEGFLGYRTIDENIDRREPLGAGLLQPVSPIADTITTRGNVGDFRTSVARNFAINPGGNPLLFVVKKNTSVLRNLFNWVVGVAETQGGSTIRNVPLIVIDDESDYASVDTKLQEFEDIEPDEEHDPTAINRWIRKILKAFDRSVYIGYTATPFANIFIHEKGKTDECAEDLFPRSFIFSLPIPDNYIGPTRMFGLDSDESEGLPIFRFISDHAESISPQETVGWIPPKHKKEHVPYFSGQRKVPPTLKRAIMSFILSTAARKARGQTDKHNSMLVHVTRFVNVQDHVKEQVESEFLFIKDRIIYGDGDRDSVLSELRSLWNSDYVPVSGHINEPDIVELRWEQVAEKLPETVNSIVVKKIHGSSDDALEYTKRTQAGQTLDVIAIGGDKLSRGLTLEGLTVSYFLRASRMYDTLMQMGRWFGYRPGYLDLCRIYTTKELNNWFRHISRASEELRQDLSRMMISNSTPREFGHRVLNHPLMMVTSPAKMRYTEKRQVTYDGCITETILFRLQPDVVEKNFQNLKTLFVGLLKDEESGHVIRNNGKYHWKGVTPERVLDFINNYQAHPGIIKARPDYIYRYIIEQLKNDNLIDWHVYIAQGDGEAFEIAPGHSLHKVERAWFQPPEPPVEITYKEPYRVKRVGSPDHEYIDLEKPDEYRRALEKTIQIWKASEKTRREERPEKPAGPGVRFVRPPQRGLICIYPVEPQLKDTGLQIERPLVGFFISFPGDPHAKPISYVVSEVLKRQEEEGFWDE